jgi:methylenetetrahydrofolate--tRNA-(uracil-5-)-methyltransferase
MKELIIIGGGLAGCEAAWQAAQRGIPVSLFEMRPSKMTGAHQTDGLAELVCSNSLGSKLRDRASGLLKEEIRLFDSLILNCAEESALPAGGALAVDRATFSSLVTARISQHPNITVHREEMTTIPQSPVIIASGPLTSATLAESIKDLLEDGGLAFFDAIAPIIETDSINMDIAFRGSRYERGELSEGDYINCPFNKDEYDAFVEALVTAERIKLKSFEEAITSGVKAGMHTFFEGCLPAEIIASRGHQSLAFGPMRPIGIIDPRTDRRPYAVLQLRQDNYNGSLYNMVGFQTNLKFSEQRRVFRMIPGLENAVFARYGQMHRNTFIASPKFLKATLQYKERNDMFFAGQIIGVEGYIGNVASGLLAGLNAARILIGKSPLTLPPDTMTGALMEYIAQADLSDFQPMKANFGILPPFPKAIKEKKRRYSAYADRALLSMQNVIDQNRIGVQ